MDAISVKNLVKRYGALLAVDHIDFQVAAGECFGSLGPNGAGKTTLISIICGIVSPTSGSVTVAGRDIARDYRAVRSMIGLVPQELATDMFETVEATVRFSRGLFGKPADAAHIEHVLRQLSLWDKRDARIMTLSGGMKRRLLIAKALAHEPTILFLDEPSAGVDVELRREMWDIVRALRSSGVTIILTTHYIEEAEAMADRVGVIARGDIIVVEEKVELMRKLGLELHARLDEIPAGLARRGLQLAADGRELVFTYDTRADRTGITALLGDMRAAGIAFRDLETRQSSLEDIFVDLVRSAR